MRLGFANTRVEAALRGVATQPDVLQVAPVRGGEPSLFRERQHLFWTQVHLAQADEGAEGAARDVLIGEHGRARKPTRGFHEIVATDLVPGDVPGHVV